MTKVVISSNRIKNYWQ